MNALFDLAVAADRYRREKEEAKTEPEKERAAGRRPRILAAVQAAAQEAGGPMSVVDLTNAVLAKEPKLRDAIPELRWWKKLAGECIAAAGEAGIELTNVRDWQAANPEDEDEEGYRRRVVDDLDEEQGRPRSYGTKRRSGDERHNDWITNEINAQMSMKPPAMSEERRRAVVNEMRAAAGLAPAYPPT